MLQCCFIEMASHPPSSFIIIRLNLSSIVSTLSFHESNIQLKATNLVGYCPGFERDQYNK
jgi:hypothetical protein